MEAEKEALVMQLFGGLPKLMPDGTKIRGEIHILLVGDPSTPASHPLRYIANLLPRSIYMSKRISSSGKPTIAVVKDEFGEGRWRGRWSLEAGALALADTGIACIDGLDKISPEDRSALHQAMEQQEISVVKEGIDVMLKSRCAVLGVANPKYGRFDEHQPLPDQIDMPPTLLSKFDLIFPIVDRPNKEADYLLEIHKFGEEATNEKEGATGFDVGTEFSLRGEIKPKIDPQLLRKYIVWAKRNVFPVLAGDATEVIKNYFLDLRHASAKSIQCAPRQLDSLIRLAEASARARLSSEVEFSDAKRAIKIMESFTKGWTG
jgi:replicative DNA helicase Mcm